MTTNHPSFPPFEGANETRAIWSPAHELFLIELMVEKVVSCGDGRAASTFSKNQWADIRKGYYQRWGLKHDLKAFKNKMNTLKERLNDFKNLLEGSSGLGWDPVLKTVTAPDSWWDEHIKKNPRAKRFRDQGCPEYEQLAVIFGDTVAIGHLEVTRNCDFNSTNGEDALNVILREKFPPTPYPMAPLEGNFTNNETRVYKRDKNEQDQSRSRSRTPNPSTSSQRSRSDSIGSEINEALKMLVESYQARLEMRNKYTISECIEILDAMGPDVESRTYMQALKLLQERGWREAFIHMSDDRRKNWLRSIEDGVI